MIHYQEVFQFKEFEIFQSDLVFKVNTDAVLLLAALDKFQHRAPQNILEIGSGSGLIAIGLALNNKQSKITTIDLDKNAYELSVYNAHINRCSHIECIHTAYQYFSPDIKFDLVVSNPPFYKNSLKSVKQRNHYAKYTDHLNFRFLLEKSACLMENDGVLALILPFSEKSNLLKIAEELYLCLMSEFNIIPKNGQMANRTILFLSHKRCLTNIPFTTKTLTIRDINNEFTSDYKNFTKKYYMNF